jgi:hypothetical protein
MKTRTKIGLILGMLLLIVIFLKEFIFRCNTAQDFFINLITEIIGALVTLIIVDQIVANEEVNQRKRLFSAAIKSLKNPLRRYINMWLNISNSDEEIVDKELASFISLNQFLISDNFIKRIKNRSFNEPHTKSTILWGQDKRTLREQVPKIQEQFKDDINRIIGNYAHAFDPDTIELLQHFAETAHLYMAFYFGQVADIGDNRWFSQYDTENIRNHMKSLNELLDKYNNNVYEKEKWTKDNILKLTKMTGNIPNIKW